ncbi:MAG: nuclear transport factor 2 family protein [Limisphaerales bacterium]
MSKQDRFTLERLEEELWREETRFDRGRMTEIIAPDFLEFGRSGRIYCREDSLAVSPQPIDAVFPLPDFEARLLHPDVAQVTYNSAVRYDGVLQRARRSSIWSRTSGGWILRFHQGTPYDT